MEQPICCQCGKPRSPLSGRRCRVCYVENARVKKSGTPLGELTKVLLELEREGRLFQRPDGWRLPDERNLNIRIED